MGAKACLYRQEIYHSMSLGDGKPSKTKQLNMRKYIIIQWPSTVSEKKNFKKSSFSSSHVQGTRMSWHFHPYNSSIFALLVRQNMVHAKCIIIWHQRFLYCVSYLNIFKSPTSNLLKSSFFLSRYGHLYRCLSSYVFVSVYAKNVIVFFIVYYRQFIVSDDNDKFFRSNFEKGNNFQDTCVECTVWKNTSDLWNQSERYLLSIRIHT